MPRSPQLRRTEPYPFAALDRARAEMRAAGVPLIDFAEGDPREETPEIVRRALAGAITPVSSYPRAAGLPELRAAIAGWARRRFGVELDPEEAILPTLGSKEIIFFLAQCILDPAAGKDTVIVTGPGYTVPGRGAEWAGGRVVRLPLAAERGFLPDLQALEPAELDRTALLWTNYPNNPTGAVAPSSFHEQVAELARRHDFVYASDEAYTELYFGDPPPSALQCDDPTNVVSIHTLSKRSSMTGYRSGFIAGDPNLIADLRHLRPATGMTPQEFVQRASVVAWNDDAHVEELRKRYSAKRDVFLSLFAQHGVEVEGSEASFYLWFRTPREESSEAFAMRMLEAGIVVAPGTFFGPEGEGYVRMALVPALGECERAASMMGDLLR